MKISNENRIDSYFHYFEEKFDFSDKKENYTYGESNGRTPTLIFKFSAYNKEWSLINQSLNGTTKENVGIERLRTHIFSHYSAYIINEFSFENSLENNLFNVKKFLADKGYELKWDQEVYDTVDSNELYIDSSISPNLRVNRSNKTISLEEEMAFYKGKSMESFDYQEYMEYFDYGVVLTGTYAPKEGEEPEPINQRELDKVVEEAMQNERITVLLTPKEPE
ncbi:hypothetical protein [Enterococcus sp. LJL51]|uniref:hypothetical protein n=1 Tax=Enterococcus sp. LJL51 TaxID=3416656 RepID=UPI003CEABBFD